jgi:type IV secretion system protein VirB3
MSGLLEHDTLFVALTRPQMFAGVTYGVFVANAVVTTELFLVSRSIWAVGVAIVVHAVGVALCLKDPRIFDLWVARAARCPRIRNYRVWQCNSYRP